MLLVPSEPPVNVNVLSADANTITVSWSPIDDYNVNGILQGYMVFYRSEIDFGDYSKIQVGQSTQQATIRGSFNPHVLYEITVAGITQVGVGVKSFPQFVRPGKRVLSFCNLPFDENHKSVFIQGSFFVFLDCKRMNLIMPSPPPHLYYLKKMKL